MSIYASSMFYLFKYFVYNSYKPAHSPHHTTHHENQEIKPGSLPTSDPQTSLKFGQLSGQCPLQQDGTVQNHTLHLVARSLVRKKSPGEREDRIKRKIKKKKKDFTNHHPDRK